jgi:hypothetical protein
LVVKATIIVGIIPTPVSVRVDATVHELLGISWEEQNVVLQTVETRGFLCESYD